MSGISLELLVERIKQKRGLKGIREIAARIGISSATLSRVERGYLPDLETFQKICQWVEIDPGEVLGFQSVSAKPEVRVHFKKESTMSPATAQALSELILLAQKELLNEESV